MADEKKEKESKINWLRVLYNTGVGVAAAGVVFFGYLKLTKDEIWFMERIINCYTICFAAISGFFSVRFLMAFRKNGRKMNYQQWAQVTVTTVITACFLNCIASDFSRSKVSDVIEIDETTSVILCEVEDKKTGNTKIEVYRERGYFVRQLGVVDELLFSRKCIEEGAYRCSVDDGGATFRLYCDYGVYGDGRFMLNPAYDTGTLEYVFEIDKNDINSDKIDN